MHYNSSKFLPAAHLLSLAGAVLIASPNEAFAQIYLNPTQQTMTRSRVSIELGDGLRCNSDGGSVPTLGLSVGAYPEQFGSNNVILENGRANSNQGSLLGLLTINIPLNTTSQSFDCRALLQDAQAKARLASLRELLEEGIINESQFRQAALKAFAPILAKPAHQESIQSEVISSGNSISIQDDLKASDRQSSTMSRPINDQSGNNAAGQPQDSSLNGLVAVPAKLYPYPQLPDLKN